MTPCWTPPVLLHPDRSADAPRVREIVAQLRPQHIVVTGDPWMSCLAGLGPVEGAHVAVACPDPALRAVLEAARAGRLVEAVGNAPANCDDCDYAASDKENDFPCGAAGPPSERTNVRRFVEAGVGRPVWCPLAQWRERAEAAQAWAAAHLACIVETDVDAHNWLIERVDSQSRELLIVSQIDPTDPTGCVRSTRGAAKAGVGVVAWADDASIDLWAPPGRYHPVIRTSDRWRRGEPPAGYAIELAEDRLCNGLAWTRREDGSWLGLSEAAS